MKIERAALRTMVDHSKRDYPDEACGYLAGCDGVVTMALPMKNVHASPTSYEMDGAEQVKVQRQMREEKLEHIAIYHSHVATQAYPSRRDIDRATAVQDFFDGLYVLVTLMNSGQPNARAFTIRDGHVTEEDVEDSS